MLIVITPLVLLSLFNLHLKICNSVIYTIQFINLLFVNPIVFGLETNFIKLESSLKKNLKSP